MKKIILEKSITYLITIVVIVFLSSCSSKKEIVKTESKIENEKQIANKYAIKLNTDKRNIKNEKLYYFIDDWYGTPYKYGGQDKTGIDCSGFVYKLYDVVYGKKVNRNSEELYIKSEKIKKTELREGDLVFFKIDSKKISHVGIYLMNNKFVHASSKKGIMISDLAEEYFIKHFHSAARIN